MEKVRPEARAMVIDFHTRLGRGERLGDTYKGDLAAAGGPGRVGEVVRRLELDES